MVAVQDGLNGAEVQTVSFALVKCLAVWSKIFSACTQI